MEERKLRDIEIACTFACFVPHLHHHSLIHQRAARGKFLVCPARPCSCRSSTLLISISSALASRPAFLDVARRRSRRRRDARWSPRRPRARWFSSPRSNFFSSPRTRARTSRCTATGWLLRLNSPLAMVPRRHLPLDAGLPSPLRLVRARPGVPRPLADPGMLTLQAEPYDTPATTLFMRCTVIVSDALLALGALWITSRPATDLRAPPLVPASPPARSSSSSSSSAPVF